MLFCSEELSLKCLLASEHLREIHIFKPCSLLNLCSIIKPVFPQWGVLISDAVIATPQYDLNWNEFYSGQHKRVYTRTWACVVLQSHHASENVSWTQSASWVSSENAVFDELHNQFMSHRNMPLSSFTCSQIKALKAFKSAQKLQNINIFLMSLVF